MFSVLMLILHARTSRGRVARYKGKGDNREEIIIGGEMTNPILSKLWIKKN